MPYARKSSATQHVWWEGEHRLEHWHRDNSVYFITRPNRAARHAKT